MTCITIPNGIVCVADGIHRLRTATGRYIYLEWHRYLGPTFYYDKFLTRLFDDWWANPDICEALDWFVKRGHKA